MKKAIALLLLAAMALSVSACQKTPEGSIVTGKSSDDLIAKAQADAGAGALAGNLSERRVQRRRAAASDH